jgi:hypothetical protein
MLRAILGLAHPGVLVHRSFRLVVAAFAVSCSAVLATPALAAEPLRRSVEIDGVASKHAVRDVIVEQSARATPARIESFADAQGRAIRIATDIQDIDLAPYAAVLAQTLHGAEISTVLVEVVPWSVIEAACGAPQVVGCYFPGQLRIVVTDYDPRGADELVHTIVHEYGHHVDQQLENLGHLDPRCVGGDGSRSWWWVRAPSTFTCNSWNWELLLAELYAEDYAVANGILGWQLTTIGPPSAFVQSRIAYDFATRFVPRALTRSGLVRRHRWRSWSFTVRHWTWLTASLRGPYRADLDLYLFRAGAQRPLTKSLRLGSSELIVHTLRPGRYEIAVRSAGAGGRATVRLALR